MFQISNRSDVVGLLAVGIDTTLVVDPVIDVNVER